MDTYITKAPLDAYRRQLEVIEAACADALINGGGVLLLRRSDGSIVVEVTDDVPDGEIHERYDMPARYITGVEPKSRPPASGGVTFQMVVDSHPERIQQETARLVEDDVRRRQSRRSRAW